MSGTRRFLVGAPEPPNWLTSTAWPAGGRIYVSVFHANTRLQIRKFTAVRGPYQTWSREMPETSRADGWSAAWGVVALILASAAVASWMGAMPPGPGFPRWPACDAQAH